VLYRAFPPKKVGDKVMINTFKGIVTGLVMLILVVILCQTVLPDYLPVDGSLDFLAIIIPLAVGFGLVIFTIAGMFRGSKD
jgi:hypothetical protein